MEFANGKHLANYLLKIFKNNDVDVPKEHIENIRDLEHVFNFMTNLTNSIRKNIDFSHGYYPWIDLAQGSRYKKLSDISKLSNEHIAKFTNNPSAISFDTVFNSFELGIEYNLNYLRTKPDEGDIYYPHLFKILDGSPKFFQWNIAYYTKPNIPKEDNIGCYFIYDNNGEIVYIGKSNSNLYERSCTSAQERTKGNFSKIELYSMPTHADTNIYEMLPNYTFLQSVKNTLLALSNNLLMIYILDAHQFVQLQMVQFRFFQECILVVALVIQMLVYLDNKSLC